MSRQLNGPWPLAAAFGLGSVASRRAAVTAAFLLAGAAGFLATDTELGAASIAMAGPDLVRLLRAMAAIKSVMAVAAFGAILWRLGAPASPGKLATYAAAGAAMAAGPGLIWGMAHVALGALLLHGGLACAAILLWRDPATARLLAAALQRKARPPAPTYY